MYSENEGYEEGLDGRQGSSNKLKDFYESNKKMVFILGGLLLLFVVLLMMNSCNKDSEVTDPSSVAITIQPANQTITKGNNTKLVANILPEGSYPNAIYKWESSDVTIASIDNLGNVNANNLGTATITVSFDDENGKPHSAKSEITVVEGDVNVKVTNVSFPEGELLITVQSAYELPKQVVPSNGCISDITYTSTDSNIVEVSNEGIVRAKNKGVATISMSVNGGAFEDEMKINVVEDIVETQMIVNPVAFNFDNNELTIIEGEYKKLTYQVLPSEAYVGDLVWSSSDESVAVVENGVVTAIKEGIAVITAETRNGESDTISIKVEKNFVKVKSIDIESSKNVSLNVNDVSAIVVNVLPEDATDKTVKYESSNSAVARVDNKGIITAVSAGGTIITVTTNDGNYSDFVTVTVTGSSSGNSDSGSSGSSGSSCGKNDIITIKTNSGGIVQTEKEKAEKYDEDDYFTKDKLEIYTDNIGSSSCSAVKTIHYCYGTSECSNFEELDDLDDDIIVDIPAGKGILQIRIKVELKNGDKFTKDYYMGFNNDKKEDEDPKDDDPKEDEDPKDEDKEPDCTFNVNIKRGFLPSVTSYKGIVIQLTDSKQTASELIYSYVQKGDTCSLDFKTTTQGVHRIMFPFSGQVYYVKKQYESYRVNIDTKIFQFAGMKESDTEYGDQLCLAFVNNKGCRTKIYNDVFEKTK